MKAPKLMLLLIGSGIVLASAGCTGEKGERGVEKVNPKIAILARPFPLRDVRLLDGPFKEAMERDRKYLHELESDRLLHNFRVNAGLPSTAQPLGGWEEPKCELRGHFVGHFLSACSLMYAATGDEALRTKANGIIAELGKCQKALGKSGYLSAYPEEFIDRVMAGKRVWAPWYTLHKIMAGLLDMYTYCGNKQALNALEKMAGWAKMRTDRLDDEAMQRMLRTEFGGMNDVLANLYAVTGNPDHLALARRFDHKVIFEPLANHRDELKGLHVNTQIPKMIGAGGEYELTGDRNYYEIAAYFWDEVVNHRSYCTGGTSNYESWQSDPDQMAGELSNASHETCCTYNMLKLTRELFTWSPDARFADYYERALFNGILSTQDPETGMTMYYVPMASGWYKTFCSPRDSFWCCTGTGIESPAKFGDSIYFHDDAGIYVNLFIASEVKWPEKGVSLRQETRFPEEGGTALILNCPQETGLELRLRVPYWATKGVTIKINGETQDVTAGAGSYLSLSRTWKDGDRVSVEMPLSLHLWRMPDDPKLAAIMFGPLVLAGELPTGNLPKEAVYGPYHAEGKPAPAPDFVAGTENLEDWIQPAAGEPLTFRTDKAGRPGDVTLVPFYRLFGKRYALYGRFYTEAEWKEFEAKRKVREAEETAKQKALLERTVDSVAIGDEKSETEHKLQSDRSEFGYHLQRSWRHATRSGWFSYDMKVLQDKPMVLMCTYWGSDVGRTFDILVDGTKIATQIINVNRPGDFFDVAYEIPSELTRGKNKVTVKFQSYPDGIAGGLFGLMILK
jgi:uncharacterized protein